MKFELIDAKNVPVSQRSPGRWAELQKAFGSLVTGKALAVTLDGEKPERVKSAIARACKGKNYQPSFSVSDGVLYAKKVAKTATVGIPQEGA